MRPSNDNATDKVIPFFERAVEIIFSDPASLLADDSHSELCDILECEGYDVAGDMEMCRDLAVISEIIRAMLYRYSGKYHSYQDFLDQVKIAHAPDEI